MTKMQTGTLLLSQVNDCQVHAINISPDPRSHVLELFTNSQNFDCMCMMYHRGYTS